MERIASFQVDHKKLNRGIYVSRLDEINGNYITTFDVRMKLPNREPVINIAELHTIEHLGATFLRNHPTRKDEIIYFGPMGCRTGFYVILKGKLESKDIVELMKEMFDFISKFEGDIPGASAIECGNYLDQNLPMARYEAKKYLEETLNNIKEENVLIIFDYPMYSKVAKVLAKMTKENKAKIILFTDSDNAPLAEYSDILYKVKLNGISVFNSLIST